MSLTKPNSPTAREADVEPPVIAGSNQSVRVTWTDPDATSLPTAPVRRPGPDTLRLTFQIRLEDAHRVLLEFNDNMDFKYRAHEKTIASVGDRVRNLFDTCVVGPLLTTTNEYVRERLDALKANAGDDHVVI